MMRRSFDHSFIIIMIRLFLPLVQYTFILLLIIMSANSAQTGAAGAVSSSLWKQRLSVILVTSPSPGNPDTAMIQAVKSSLYFLGISMGEVPLRIICDGYKTRTKFRDHEGRDNPWCMSKMGIISPESAELYERYCDSLREEYRGAARVAVQQLSEHHGFAKAVQVGLKQCETTYCLVLQHDRSFCRPVSNLEAVLGAMDRDETVRYVGFNTFKSALHDETIGKRYDLRDIFSSMALPLDDTSSYLFPLLFWYDSNHIAHVQRYLEVYTPFVTAPAVVRDEFGARGMKDMLLRAGDFIEDRLGQAQRNMLVALRRQNKEEEIRRLVRWFGTYLLWTPVEAGDVEGWRERVVVTHMRGRNQRARDLSKKPHVVAPETSSPTDKDTHIESSRYDSAVTVNHGGGGDIAEDVEEEGNLELK